AEVWTFVADRQYDALAFCPTTSQVVVGKSRDGLVVFHDLLTGQEVRRAKLPVPTGQTGYSQLVFAPAGGRLAFPTSPHQVALWEFPEIRRLTVFDAAARDGPLTALALSDRGRYLATRQQDNVVTVWETQTRQPLLTLALENEFLVHQAF